MNFDDDDDPVVQEIPVYLSKILDDKLFIFQYPLKPNTECYDNATFHKTEIKPINGEIRLEVNVDINSVNYDHRKGERIAADIDGPHSRYEAEKEGDFFSCNMMNKIVLQSSRVVADSSNYSVGFFQNNELHLTPLKSIMDMRPQFNYLDTTDKQARENAKKLAEEKGEDEPIQIGVKFERPTPDFVKKREDKSFKLQTRKISDEKWIKTGFKQSNSHEAELTRLDMLCPTTESSSNNLKLLTKEYLDTLVQPAVIDEYSKTNTQTSLGYIRTLTLLDQVRLLMKDAKVMSFNQLKNIISPEHDSAAILKYLQQVAVLVQGNWIVNSELLFPKEYVSTYNGVSADLMCRARDYILSKFTENEYIDRKAISSVVHLRPDEISEIIMKLAKRQPKKGWHLVLPPDTEFEKKYPEIAQRQELFWETKRQYLRSIYGAQNLPPKRQRRRSNRESIGSENEEKNIGRGKKPLPRESPASDDSSVEPAKTKKSNKKK